VETVLFCQGESGKNKKGKETQSLKKRRGKGPSSGKYGRATKQEKTLPWACVIFLEQEQEKARARKGNEKA